jgi:hypothetical protein
MDRRRQPSRHRHPPPRDDPADYLADSGVGRAVLDTIPATDKPAALQAVTDALAPHTTNDGVHLDAAIWITTGTTMT